MTDIPVGGFAVEESGWSRFKKQIGAGFRAIGRGLKTAATAVWNATKKAAIAVGRGTVKVLGLTGQSIGWIVGVVITAAIMIAVSVMWLALTALVGLVWLLRWTYDGFDTYVVGVFRYLARSDRTKTFKQVNVLRTSSITTGLSAWYFALLGLRSRLENYGGPAAEGDISKLVAEAEAAGHPLTEAEEDIIAQGNAVAEAVRDQALITSLQIKAEKLAAEHPEFDAPGPNRAIDENPVLAEISKFVGVDPAEPTKEYTRVDFDFTPFINVNGKNFVLLDALAWLRDDADNKAERSYWAGRWEALAHYENDRSLDKAWARFALVSKKVQRELHNDYRLTEARLGYGDMVDELQAKKLQPQVRGQKR